MQVISYRWCGFPSYGCDRHQIGSVISERVARHLDRNHSTIGTFVTAYHVDPPAIVVEKIIRGSHFNLWTIRSVISLITGHPVQKHETSTGVSDNVIGEV